MGVWVPYALSWWSLSTPPNNNNDHRLSHGPSRNLLFRFRTKLYELPETLAHLEPSNEVEAVILDFVGRISTVEWTVGRPVDLSGVGLTRLPTRLVW